MPTCTRWLLQMSVASFPFLFLFFQVFQLSSISLLALLWSVMLLDTKPSRPRTRPKPLFCFRDQPRFETLPSLLVVPFIFSILPAVVHLSFVSSVCISDDCYSGRRRSRLGRGSLPNATSSSAQLSRTHHRKSFSGSPWPGRLNVCHFILFLFQCLCLMFSFSFFFSVSPFSLFFSHRFHLIIHHSFIPGLKLSFSANPSHCCLPFLLNNWLNRLSLPLPILLSIYFFILKAFFVFHVFSFCFHAVH